jgi:NAD(P)-dependent dehydrogenase (short-subunit alcohol dehydrogenase family)
MQLTADSTPQSPIDSGWSAQSTAADVLAGIDLAGRLAVVTGGYSGLGLAVTRALSDAGATVIVPARSKDKAAAALADLPRAILEEIDLLVPESIDAFAARVAAQHESIDILVNCAGIMAAPLMRDARGYEVQFAGNHLGHFHLAARLWPLLTAMDGARVVTVSSHGHRLAGIDFDDPSFERRTYEKWSSYGQSKTANILFTVALDALGRDKGVRAFSLHPGSIYTDLMRHLSDEDLSRLGARDADGNVAAHYRTPEQGASTIVWCAASPQLDGKGGVYCIDGDIAKVIAADAWTEEGVVPHATDPALAERLWKLSEDLTGVPFEG